uniref:phytoene desaturase family protein n=1 Tax=Streptomyces scabiei TaxID=1930 RepID=UPI003BAE529A
LLLLLPAALGVLLGRVARSAFVAPLAVVAVLAVTMVFVAEAGSPAWLRGLTPVLFDEGARPLPSDLVGRPAAWHALYLLALAVLVAAGAVLVRGGRAAGVLTSDGEKVAARRAVLADVSAPSLYGELVDAEHLPPQLTADLKRFQWDFATFKVDWACDGPVPWRAEAAARAGTVHLADGVDELTRCAAQIAMGQVPDRPFALFGQMTTADPSRSPRGTEAAWAYTHVPHVIKSDAGDDGLTGRWDRTEQEVMADRVERQVERFAPGFRSRIRARRVLAPPTLQALDRNLHGGAINGGTAALHQQLFFRPAPGTGRPETPVDGLYLASASAHPGGGVHGAPGANAARAALRRHRPPGGCRP